MDMIAEHVTIKNERTFFPTLHRTYAYGHVEFSEDMSKHCNLKNVGATRWEITDI